MVEVTERSANWRIFGGTGVALGGLLIGLGALLSKLALVDVAPWLLLIGFFVLGVALLFVAFGQTGSNGAVGASLFGKIALLVAGVAAILHGLFALLGFFGVALPVVLGQIVLLVFAVFLLLSAIAIFQRGVAKGIAKWILFVPAVIAIIGALERFAIFNSGEIVTILFGLFTLVAGLAFLFNKADFK